MHDFPRDPNSSFNHIDNEAIRVAVISLVDGIDATLHGGFSSDFSAMVAGDKSWNVVNMLKLGAICAFVKGLDDADYNAALIKQGLADRGWSPDKRYVPTR